MIVDSFCTRFLLGSDFWLATPVKNQAVQIRWFQNRQRGAGVTLLHVQLLAILQRMCVCVPVDISVPHVGVPNREECRNSFLYHLKMPGAELCFLNAIGAGDCKMSTEVWVRA